MGHRENGPTLELSLRRSWMVSLRRASVGQAVAVVSGAGDTRHSTDSMTPSRHSMVARGCAPLLELANLPPGCLLYMLWCKEMINTSPQKCLSWRRVVTCRMEAVSFLSDWGNYVSKIRTPLEVQWELCNLSHADFECWSIFMNWYCLKIDGK